jgi:glycosyltransferase involved in cell wall biosynthesis
MSELRALVSGLRLGDRIHFAGLQSDMPAVYHSLELLVSTSTTEGLPFALMEGMAAGLASVATQVGGVPEIVEMGTTGLLVEPGEPHRQAQAVAELMRDPARRSAMGAAAKLRVQQRFSLEDSVHRMDALLHRLHGNASSGPAAQSPAAQSTSKLGSTAGNGANRPRHALRSPPPATR